VVGVSSQQQNEESQDNSPDGDSTPELRTIAARLEAHSKRIESLEDEREDVRKEHDALRGEVEGLQQENKDLRAEIERLDARTDLLSLVENSDEMTAKQRRIALIQHLKKAAEKERERGRDAKASMNKEEAEAALKYPDIDRTTFYDDLRKAPRLIGMNDVLWYESNSGGESRLKLNLENGDLPGDVVGHPRRNGGE
jgi:predicted RNase H-like nuclease (RuvC/YqgF family)